MPFTLSHPAAILPLRRLLGTQAVLPALVIGSMAPDFPYFVGLGGLRNPTHEFAALLWFAIPVGWCAFGLYRSLLRPAFLFVAPAPIARRFQPEAANGSFRAVSLCFALGAATHIVWDAATHRPGFLVQHFAPLRRVLLRVLDHPVSVYALLQHGSTLLGAFCLAYACRSWFLRSEIRRTADGGSARARGAARGALLLVPLAAALPGALPRISASGSVHAVTMLVVLFVIQHLLTFCLVLGAIGVALQIAARRDLRCETPRLGDLRAREH